MSSHNFRVFVDTNPKAPEEEKYKAVGGYHVSNNPAELLGYMENEEIDQILDDYNEEIEETDRNLLGLIALGIAFDIAIFAIRVERAVQTFRAAGVSEQSIFGILSEDLSNYGSIFGGLRNSIVRGIVLGNNQFSRIGQLGVYGNSIESFRWVTIKGH